MILKIKGFMKPPRCRVQPAGLGLGRTLGTVMTMSTYLVLRSAGFTI